jgi:hypothetical protein
VWAERGIVECCTDGTYSDHWALMGEWTCTTFVDRNEKFGNDLAFGVVSCWQRLEGKRNVNQVIHNELLIGRHKYRLY